MNRNDNEVEKEEIKEEKVSGLLNNIKAGIEEAKLTREEDRIKSDRIFSKFNNITDKISVNVFKILIFLILPIVLFNGYKDSITEKINQSVNGSGMTYEATFDNAMYNTKWETVLTTKGFITQFTGITKDENIDIIVQYDILANDNIGIVAWKANGKLKSEAEYYLFLLSIIGIPNNEDISNNTIPETKEPIKEKEEVSEYIPDTNLSQTEKMELESNYTSYIDIKDDMSDEDILGLVKKCIFESDSNNTERTVNDKLNSYMTDTSYKIASKNKKNINIEAKGISRMDGSNVTVQLVINRNTLSLKDIEIEGELPLNDTDKLLLFRKVF